MAANTLEDVRRYAYDYNNKRNKPPLDDNEVERQIKDAINFVNKKRDERENDRNAVPEEMGLELDNEQIQEICDIVASWRDKEEGAVVVNAICSLLTNTGIHEQLPSV